MAERWKEMYCSTWRQTCIHSHRMLAISQCFISVPLIVLLCFFSHFFLSSHFDAHSDVDFEITRIVLYGKNWRWRRTAREKNNACSERYSLIPWNTCTRWMNLSELRLFNWIMRWRWHSSSLTKRRRRRRRNE